MKIFMIGTQRSGSNLLRLMINQAPDIAAPHPPHILERFAPLLPIYGDLAQERNFVRLVDDVVRMVEVNPVPWGVTFDRADIRRRCRDNSSCSRRAIHRPWAARLSNLRVEERRLD